MKDWFKRHKLLAIAIAIVVFGLLVAIGAPR
jgi:hypothetical protein